MNLSMRRRLLTQTEQQEEAEAEQLVLPATLWDFENPDANRPYVVEESGDQNAGYGYVDVLNSGMLRCRVYDNSQSLAYHAAAIFGPFDMSNCSAITLLHDRHYNNAGGGWVRLGVFQSLQSYASGAEPLVFQESVVKTHGNAETNQKFELDVRGIVGGKVIVVDARTAASANKGAYIYTRRLTVS